MSQDKNLPQHIGLILDGNRRWARKQGMLQLEGHRRGYDTLKTIAKHARMRGIRYVSAYVFSTENWQRSSREVTYLMKLLHTIVSSELSEFVEENGRVVWVGSREGLSASILRDIEKAEKQTQHNTGGTLILCLNHGGHREIAEAVQRIIDARLESKDVHDGTVGQYLDHPEIPPVDLVIRTSGEQRLSNFMLWRAAYSEFIFRDEFWPDFTPAAFDECLVEYSKRQRRFGG